MPYPLSTNNYVLDRMQHLHYNLIIQVILILDFFISGLGVSLAVCKEASIVTPGIKDGETRFCRTCKLKKNYCENIHILIIHQRLANSYLIVDLRFKL